MFELTNDDKAAFKKLSEYIEKQYILSNDVPIFDWQGSLGLAQEVDRKYVDAYNASLLVDSSLDIHHLNKTNEYLLKLGLISQEPSMWSDCKPDEKFIIAMFKSVLYKLQNEIPQIQLKILNRAADAAPIITPFVPTAWGKAGYIVILKLFEKYLKTVGNTLSDGITLDDAKKLFDIDTISDIDKEQMKTLLLSPEAKEYINNLYVIKMVDEKIEKSVQHNNARDKNSNKNSTENNTDQQGYAQKLMINIQHTLDVRLGNLSQKSHEQSMQADYSDSVHKNASHKKVYLMQQAITGVIKAYMDIINKQEQNATDKRMLENMDRYLQEIKIDNGLSQSHNFIFNSMASIYFSNHLSMIMSGKLIHSNQKQAIATKYFSMIAQYNASNTYYCEKLSEIQTYKESLERYYKKQLCMLADYTGDYSGLNTADFFTLGVAVIPSLAQYNDNNDLVKFFNGVIPFLQTITGFLDAQDQREISRMRYKLQRIGNDLATANKLTVSISDRMDREALQKANLEHQMLSTPHLMTVAARKEGIEKALMDNEKELKEIEEKINKLNRVAGDNKVTFQKVENEVNELYSKRLEKLNSDLKKHAECRVKKGKADDCLCKDCKEWIQQRNDINDIINSKLALVKFKLTVSEQSLDDEIKKSQLLGSAKDELKKFKTDIDDNASIYTATETMEALLQETDSKDERYKQLVREHYNKYQAETQFHHQAIHGFTKNVGVLSSQLARYGAPPELHQACIAMQHAADIYSSLHLLYNSSAPYLLNDICNLGHIKNLSDVKFSDIGDICTKIIENSDKLSLDAVLSFFVNPGLGAIIGALGIGICLLNLVSPVEDPVLGAIRQMTTLIIEHIKQLSSTLMAIDKKHSNMLEVIHNQCDKILSVLNQVNQNISHLNRKIDIYYDERKEYDNKSNYINFMSTEHEMLEKIKKKMNTIKYLRDDEACFKIFEFFDELLEQISSRNFYVKLSVLHPGYLDVSAETGLISKPENYINLLAKWPLLQNMSNANLAMPHFDLYMHLVSNLDKYLQYLSKNNLKLDSNNELASCLNGYISKAYSIGKYIESLRNNTSWLDSAFKSTISLNKELLILFEEIIFATDKQYKFDLPTTLQVDYRDSNIIKNICDYIQMVKEKKLNGFNEFYEKTNRGSHRLIKIYVSTYASLLYRSIGVSIDKSIQDKALSRFIKSHCFPLDYFPEFLAIPSVYNDHLALLLPKSIFSNIESELIKLLSNEQMKRYLEFVNFQLKCKYEFRYNNNFNQSEMVLKIYLSLPNNDKSVQAKEFDGMVYEFLEVKIFSFNNESIKRISKMLAIDYPVNSVGGEFKTLVSLLVSCLMLSMDDLLRNNINQFLVFHTIVNPIRNPIIFAKNKSLTVKHLDHALFATRIPDHYRRLNEVTRSVRHWMRSNHYKSFINFCHDQVKNISFESKYIFEPTGGALAIIQEQQIRYKQYTDEIIKKILESKIYHESLIKRFKEYEYLVSTIKLITNLSYEHIQQLLNQVRIYDPARYMNFEYTNPEVFRLWLTKNTILPEGEITEKIKEMKTTINNDYPLLARELKKKINTIQGYAQSLNVCLSTGNDKVVYNTVSQFQSAAQSKFFKDQPQRMQLNETLGEIKMLQQGIYAVPQQNSYAGKECIVITKDDGNCAFNCFVLGFCDLIMSNQIVLELKHIIYINQWLNLDINNNGSLIDWLKVKNLNDRQFLIQPIMRKIAIGYIRHNYKIVYQELYQNYLSIAFKNYRENRAIDDIFCVHHFILQKFQTLSDPVKLISWWNEEGMDSYLNILQQSADSPLAKDHWGSEVEIGALATYFNINVYWKKNIEVLGQQLGIGGGLVFNLNNEQLKVLINLGIGSIYHNKFRINKFTSRQQLLEQLNPVPEKDMIISYLQKTDSSQNIIPNDWSIHLLNKLKSINVIKRCNNGEYNFIINDDKVDKKEIVNRLNGLQDDKLKAIILQAFRDSVPEFSVLHQGEHWSYLRSSAFDKLEGTHIQSVRSNSGVAAYNKKIL